MAYARSALVVPGSELDMIKKAVGTNAEKIIIDLEDAVFDDAKSRARRNAIQALTEFDWGTSRSSVRIDNVEKFTLRDVTALVEEAGANLDTVVLPKAKRPDDVQFVDRLLGKAEQEYGIDTQIGLELLIEDAKAIEYLHAISASADRLDALLFGSSDYVATIAGTLPDTQTPPDVSQYSRGFWNYLQVHLVQAANAYGRTPINTLGDDIIGDMDAFRKECEYAKELGYLGGWAVHPRQVPVLNDVFSPSEHDIEFARKVITALDESENTANATDMDGLMVTDAAYKNATKILDEAQKFGTLPDTASDPSTSPSP